MVMVTPSIAPNVPPDQTPGMGLDGPFVERQRFQATSSVIDKFLSIKPIPEEIWISAGMPLSVAAAHRQVQMNDNYILFGIQDIQGDIAKSMASWAGHDRLARQDAIAVATALQMGPRETQVDQARNAQKEIQGKASNQ